jgi:hypothetical protein
MAQTVTAELAQSISRDLDFALAEWASLPSVREQWDTWDEEQQLVFLEEWAIPRGALARLRGWAAAGVMDDTQTEHYRRLCRVVEANEPLIAALLGPD